MNKIIPLVLFIIVFCFHPENVSAAAYHATWWPVQSIDTMKYSRDTARTRLTDPEFSSVIDTQIKNISATGATHVSISTPYDEEFLPFLRRWVETARRYNLKIWFRGNFSGWEGWFDYPVLSRADHLQKTEAFIKNNIGLFMNGDIFTPCPECENGGPGDPRQTGDVKGFRKFMTDEYQVTQKAFNQIRVQVASNYASMNGDVARLIMDKPTTISMGGLVVIDHYVSTPEKLVADIKSISDTSGGQVVLGEFGVPIPDIHGNLTDIEQADWLERTLNLLSQTAQISGLNYWVNVGGSTEIWSKDGFPRKAVEVLTHYFKPDQFTGFIANTLGQPISGARIFYHQRYYSSDQDGAYHLPSLPPPQQIIISSPGYKDQGVLLASSQEIPYIIMAKDRPNIIYLLKELLFRLTHSIIGK
jgi:hypothetical protein